MPWKRRGSSPWPSTPTSRWCTIPTRIVSGSWRPLSGNEIGLLLADFVLGRTSGSDRLVVDTLVSSTALARLAEAHGVVHRRSRTGFKWIVREALRRPDLRFVFGYEEALGYSVDAYVRDKDAVSAALAFTALVTELASQGKTVGDRLLSLAMEHGLFTTSSWALGAANEGELDAVMAAFRRAVPARVGEHSVVRVEDFRTAGELPPTDLLVLHLDRNARVALRPSGTEAKLKVYAEVVTRIDSSDDYLAARDAARTQIERLGRSIMVLLEDLVPRT
jgi:phosphomannomutase